MISSSQFGGQMSAAPKVSMPAQTIDTGGKYTSGTKFGPESGMGGSYFKGMSSVGSFGTPGGMIGGAMGSIGSHIRL
jgi:hypothetical protein